MATDISIYFAFSTGSILFVASIVKMFIDKENIKWFFIPLTISLIILAYGASKVV